MATNIRNNDEKVNVNQVGAFLSKPIDSDRLVTIYSPDDVETLLKCWVNLDDNYYGKVLKDVALVAERLQDWKFLAEAENIIPFKFAHKTKEPTGYRIWHLSRLNESPYYKGTWFDVKIFRYYRKDRIKICKLSEQALLAFQR